MTTTDAVGRPTDGKPINLGQLQAELVAANVIVGAGLGMQDDYVYVYTPTGEVVDFRPGQQATADQCIAAHVALREKTDAEYTTEFQAAGTTSERQVEINHIMTGLMPREQVAM